MKKILYLIIAVNIFFIFANYSKAANLQDAFGDNFFKKASEHAGYKAEGNSVETTISIIISTALSLIGVVLVILIIYGGYLWMTARGNETQVEKAKNLLTAAAIGLIIIVSAYAISYFVISRLGETTLEAGTSSPK